MELVHLRHPFFSICCCINSPVAKGKGISRSHMPETKNTDFNESVFKVVRGLELQKQFCEQVKVLEVRL